jgi:DNA repair photolyase
MPTSQAQLFLPVIAQAAPGITNIPLLERNDVEYTEIAVRSLLNWVEGSHMSDVFSVNPYRGCEFGCAYCYARYTHEFLELSQWEDFERKIFVKLGAARAIRRDLGTSKDVRKHGIAIGTATDPYQPAEAKFRVTRSILRALLPYRDVPISIVTKSGLIAQDADLLAEISKRHPLTVCFSCVTTDRHLLRAIERRSPMAHVRFAAMKQLTSRGIDCKLLMMPILPGITDSKANIKAVATAAREAGARDVRAGALWLTDSSRRRFLPWLATAFPDLHRRYEAVFGEGSMYTPDAYRDMLAARVRAILTEVGFGQDATEVCVAE